MNEPGYPRILEALDKGKRAWVRARLTTGFVRFLGTAATVLGVLILWAALQRGFHFYSVPVATAASILGAGAVVFALVRWLVMPLARVPSREDFVTLVERRFPEEKNLIVNAYQLGGSAGNGPGKQAPDLVKVLVARAAERVKDLDLTRWRDPTPDRPYLWAGGAAAVALLGMALLVPGLFQGAFEQAFRPALAAAPPVQLQVEPGNVEVDRGSDVTVIARVKGTDEAPALYFRERGGTWRIRDFDAGVSEPTEPERTWETTLPEVDRNLEYRVQAVRAQSPTYAVRVLEPPRLAGFRAHLRYPAYSRLAPETITGGTGDLAALKGTDVDLRILTNRPMASAWLDWRSDGAARRERKPLQRMDATTWRTPFRLLEPAGYTVVLADTSGTERLRSPRYRVDPVPDRPPFLTLHYPQQDHDLADDMMERIVADAADDYGFSSVQLVYQVDDGPNRHASYTPFTPGQREFRLDTLWDLSGLNLNPGSVVSYYLEVRDNDAVSGPKAVRSPVRRVRFPTLDEIYAEVAEDHDREIGTLSDLHRESTVVRDRLEELNEELKGGKKLDWDLRQDVQKTLNRQQSLEQQLSEAVSRLQNTLQKASDRAQMNADLVQKMAEINDLLNNLSNPDLKRSFQALSKALEQMNRDAVRKALEDFQTSQADMLQGLDRTIELLKQIRRDEQVEDVVRRTDEIASLQNEIAKEIKKLAETAERNRLNSADAQEKQGDKQQEEGNEKQAQAGKQQDKGDKQGKQASGQKGAQTDSTRAREQTSQDLAEMQRNLERLREELARKRKQPPKESEKGGNPSQGQKPSESEQERLRRLSRQQEAVQKRVEELKRRLETLRKLNDEAPDMARNMEKLEQSETLRQMQQSMKQARQGMQSGQKQKASKYAFRARDEANTLAEMARSRQETMQQQKEDDTIQRLERVIQGLIDVSGAEEELIKQPKAETRALAQRQFQLAEATRGLADSLGAVLRQAFSMGQEQQGGIGLAAEKMDRATRLFEQGNRKLGMFQGRESASDLNETIVGLMRSHAQMCSGGGGGDQSQQMKEQLTGLSESQRQLNSATQEMLQKLRGKQRLTMSEQERLAKMAAQQEMIRKGLEEVQQNYSQARELLGDMKQLQQQMQDVEQDLRRHSVDPRILERQQKILSRLLDAQRSMRQQEMSPRRESRSATLARRQSPPPLPQDLLRHERSLEEDVLRGGQDRVPTQYRKLVEEYFRSLSRAAPAP